MSTNLAKFGFFQTGNEVTGWANFHGLTTAGSSVTQNGVTISVVTVFSGEGTSGPLFDQEWYGVPKPVLITFGLVVAGGGTQVKISGLSAGLKGFVRFGGGISNVGRDRLVVIDGVTTTHDNPGGTAPITPEIPVDAAFTADANGEVLVGLDAKNINTIFQYFEIWEDTATGPDHTARKGSTFTATHSLGTVPTSVTINGLTTTFANATTTAVDVTVDAAITTSGEYDMVISDGTTDETQTVQVNLPSIATANDITDDTASATVTIAYASNAPTGVTINGTAASAITFVSEDVAAGTKTYSYQPPLLADDATATLSVTGTDDALDAFTATTTISYANSLPYALTDHVEPVSNSVMYGNQFATTGPVELADPVLLSGNVSIAAIDWPGMDAAQGWSEDIAQYTTANEDGEQEWRFDYLIAETGEAGFFDRLLTIGAGATSEPEPVESTDYFTIPPLTGQPLNTLVEFPEVTVSNLTTGTLATVTVSNNEAQWSLNTGSGFGPFTSQRGVAELGNKLKVRIRTADTGSTRSYGNITFAGKSIPFYAETAAAVPQGTWEVGPIFKESSRVFINPKYSKQDFTYFEYSLNDGAWNEFRTTLRIRNLTPETTYNLKIRAINPSGVGVTKETSFTTEKAPSPYSSKTFNRPIGGGLSGR